MSLVQDIISSSKFDQKCPYYMVPEGIAVHNTANDASAIDERDNVNRAANTAEVSFHIAIDDAEGRQLIPFNRNAWHAGDGGNGRGNRRHIGVEICYSKSGGPRFENAEKRAAVEIAALLKQFGWGIDRVKKHQDFSNKYCPHRTLDMGWQRFLNMISDAMNGNTQTPQPPQPPITTGKEFANLKPHMQSWAIYNLNGPYTKNYKIGTVLPAKFGGLSYQILEKKGNDVYVIQTESYGRVAIWVPRDNDSSFTSSPVYGVSAPSPTKEYLNLNAHVSKWNVYPTNVAPVIGNQCGALAPSQFKGLSYEILGKPQANVYTIQTSSFGKVNIFAPRDNDSSITNAPKY